MRIVTIPLLKVAPHAKAAASHTAFLPLASNLTAVPFSAASVPPSAVDSSARMSRKALERFMDKLQVKGKEALAEFNASIQNAPPKSLKGRFSTMLDWLRSRLDSREDLFTAVYAFHNRLLATQRHQRDTSVETSATSASPSEGGNPSLALKVLHPPSLPHHEVESLLHSFVTKGEAFHRKMFWSSLAATPVTFAATVLPGPNVFLAWNAYRVYCHYTAWHGARAFLRLRQQSPSAVHFQADESLERIISHSQTGSDQQFIWDIDSVSSVVQLYEWPEFASMLQRWKQPKAIRSAFLSHLSKQSAPNAHAHAHAAPDASQLHSGAASHQST